MSVPIELGPSQFDRDDLFALLERSSSGLFYWDASLDSVQWSAKLHGSLGNVLGEQTNYLDIENLLHPDDRHAMLQQVEQSRQDKSSYEMMIRLRHRDGDYREFQVYGKWLNDRGPREQLVGYVIDLSELQQARTEAERSRQLLENFFESAPAAVYLKDSEYRHKYGNDAAAKIAGCSREEFLEKTTLEVFGEETAAELAAVDDEVLRNGRIVTYFGEATSRSGETFYIHDTKFPVTDPKTGETMVGGFGIDITKQHEAETELAQSRRLEALGRLVSGIAHDFNNSLMVMQASLDLLENNDEPEDAGDYVNELRMGIERGARLTAQLLAYGRKTVLKEETLSVSGIVQSMEGILRSSVSENITLELDLADDLLSANVDKSQIENIVLNLVINSTHAMPDGGHLTIATRNVDATEYAELSGGDGDSKKYINLEITDTGSGIAPDVLDKVFEPFFTTKDPDHGTGMGLSMVDGLMDQIGGSTKISSEVGKGTTVDLFIPAEHPVQAPEPQPEPAIVDGGEDHVLLAEDDAGVRRLLAKQLRNHGYRVTESSNGREALDTIKSDPSIALLVSDMVMPGEIQGNELAQLARGYRPALPILLMSGYPLDADAEYGGEAHFNVGLMKPVRIRDLLSKIRQVLDTPAIEAT